MSGRRFDPAPVLERMRRGSWAIVALAACAGYHPDSLGAMLRLTPDRNGRRAEGLTWWQADKLATALGCHPSELWPDWLGDCPLVA